MPLYFLMLLFFAFAIIERHRTPGFTWLAGGILLVFFGFRGPYGRDYNNYAIQYFSFDPANISYDLGSEFLYKIILGYLSQSGFSYEIFNLIFFAIFIFGILYTLSKKSNQMVLLIYLLAYLIIVCVPAVRQLAALGLLFIIYERIKNQKSSFPSIVLLILSVGFHSSSIIFGLLLIAGWVKKRHQNIALILIAIPVSYFLSLSLVDRFDYLYEKNVTSSGALAHMAIVMLPIYYVFYSRKYREEMGQVDWLYFKMSFILIPLYFLNDTAADRMSLYFYPLAVNALSVLLRGNYFNKYLVSILSFGLFVGWSLTANNAFSYLRYTNTLLTGNFTYVY